MNTNHYVAIMAGGIGSRFWPMSRTHHPKQFLDILGTGKSLIQSTYDRFARFIPAENIFVVTSRDYRTTVREQLPLMKAENILCEPSRKNTAPCIAYIAWKLNQSNPKGALICAPADHLILDETSFNKVCLEAMNFVEKHNALLTLGIKPASPNTGYGYIQFDQQPVSDNVYKVKTFTEKPNLEIAKSFVQSGEFLWNSGIFAWQARNIVGAFKKHLPEMADVFEAEKDHFNTSGEDKAIERIYPQCTNISIDYGVMEHERDLRVVRLDAGWSDVGTWHSVLGLKPEGEANFVHGPVLPLDCHHSVLISKGPYVAAIGLRDTAVVVTDKATLVLPLDRSQDVRQVVAEVQRLGRTDLL